MSQTDLCDEEVLDALRVVCDPELGVNIVDLGLVYAATRTADTIDVAMTTTSPACPLGEALTSEAYSALAARFPGDIAIHVELVFDPPWSPDRMTEAGRQQLQPWAT
jgi:metal-sulfur cluster biosynthetic enzyme